jgi:hypothetical protein
LALTEQAALENKIRFSHISDAAANHGAATAQETP